MSDGFLTRWQRRKRAVRAAELAERDAAPTAPEGGASPGDADGAAQRAALDSETGQPSSPRAASGPAESGSAEASDLLPELPDLETLTRESDLAPFLRAGVPAALRNAALRRMWSLDPAIRDFVSEAREYAYDWNSPGGVPGLGPLLPGDDVQAMLRRIVGLSPQEAAAPADDEAEPPTAQARPEVSVEPDSELVPEAEQEALPIPPLVAETVLLPAQMEPEAVTVHARPAPMPLPTARQRLRRHGGAMPS
ncbi:DUF3306 domain-containing protein [Methylobacterium radiodurans]|uniref:DUF3306 domain-containing protein n=1 Tax=Methylobacterium radiodurans TaxID=2202828 RepID=A0A2U8VYN7_9HYPH|nr:DUF3306 domain-containing protein [Methylobacterium radiodurans]AWN38481.1 DUF3306 domain-containing protein [Methylobacterium radiodurans]